MNRFAVSLMLAIGSIAILRGMVACGPTAGGGATGGARTTTSGSTGGAVTTGPTTGTGGAQGTGGGQDAGTPPAAQCADAIEDPCMRYRIPLVADANGDVNNPNNQALRDKYTAAFGDACYVSVSDTFDCFYQKWQDACADAVKIGEVSGNAPYMPGFPCVPDGVGNYTLQIGPDPANKIVINYQAAPLQTPDTDINGVATPVNGPYRNLVEVTPTAPGKDFIDDSGMVDADGGGLTQKAYILQVNMNANDGGIRSDLAGYSWPCVTDGGAMMCIEPEFLNSDPNHFLGDGRNVHHVVPAKDKRCCPWGTNSYANAAVISRTLNQYLSNDNPTRQEVIQLNDAGAYPP